MWRCALRLLVFAGSAVACGGDSEDSCSPFPSDVAPGAIDATTERLSEGAHIDALLIEDGDLYWYDDGGAIWKLPQGGARPIELRPPPGGFVGDPQRPSTELGLVIDGFISDGERLYWGEANRFTGVGAGAVIGLDPPSRLLSMAKTGGAEAVLLESSAETLRPVAMDSSSIIVRTSGGYQRLPENGSRLELLRAEPLLDTSRVVGGKIYWTEPDQEKLLLFRADFDARQPEVVARIDGSDFDVGPGYVLWRQQSLQTQPELTLQQHFVMLDEESRCARALPGLGQSISFSTALDDEYVYWYSFNALSAVTAPMAGQSAPANAPAMALIRANLNTGALQQLATPGFDPGVGSQLRGHDASWLYVSTAEGLVAVRKP